LRGARPEWGEECSSEGLQGMRWNQCLGRAVNPGRLRRRAMAKESLRTVIPPLARGNRRRSFERKSVHRTDLKLAQYEILEDR